MKSWNCFHYTLNAYKSSLMVYLFKILYCWEWGKVGMKTRNHLKVDHNVCKFGCKKSAWVITRTMLLMYVPRLYIKWKPFSWIHILMYNYVVNWSTIEWKLTYPNIL